MSTSIRDQRNRFIVKISVLEIEKQYQTAEELIRECRPLGLRKPTWLQSVNDFIANRDQWPDQPAWAIRQWIVAANYSNGSSLSGRIPSQKAGE